MSYKYEQDPQLWCWCDKQRKLFKAGKLSDERTDKLKELGFVWNLHKMTTKDIEPQPLDKKCERLAKQIVAIAGGKAFKLLHHSITKKRLTDLFGERVLELEKLPSHLNLYRLCEQLSAELFELKMMCLLKSKDEELEGIFQEIENMLGLTNFGAIGRLHRFG